MKSFPGNPGNLPKLALNFLPENPCDALKVRFDPFPKWFYESTAGPKY